MRKIFIIAVIFAFFAMPILATSVVGAVDVVDCNDPRLQQSTLCRDAQVTENPLFGPNGILTKVIYILSLVVGVAAVISMVISGLRLTISGGEPSSISSARRGILFALIGLVIAAMAQALVQFVLSKLT